MNFQRKYPSTINSPSLSLQKPSDENPQSNAQSNVHSNVHSNAQSNAHIQYLCVIHEDVQKSMSVTCGSAATNLMAFQDNFLRRIFHKVGIYMPIICTHAHKHLYNTSYSNTATHTYRQFPTAYLHTYSTNI